MLFCAFGLRLVVGGAERLPATGPAVVAANHMSFVDFTVVGLPAVRQGRLVRFMAKESVFRSRLGGPLMRAMRHIPVDRGHGAVAARGALRALQRGEVVGVYPEATIGRAFSLKDRADFKLGAARLAIETGAPLVPVAHWGMHRLLTVGPRWSLRRGRWVGIAVGEPLRPWPGEDAAALTDRLHASLSALVEELLDHCPAPPAEASRAWWWPAHRGGGAPGAETARQLDHLAVARADRLVDVTAASRPSVVSLAR